MSVFLVRFVPRLPGSFQQKEISEPSSFLLQLRNHCKVAWNKTLDLDIFILLEMETKIIKQTFYRQVLPPECEFPNKILTKFLTSIFMIRQFEKMRNVFRFCLSIWSAWMNFILHNISIMPKKLFILYSKWPDVCSKFAGNCSSELQ